VPWITQTGWAVKVQTRRPAQTSGSGEIDLAARIEGNSFGLQAAGAALRGVAFQGNLALRIDHAAMVYHPDRRPWHNQRRAHHSPTSCIIAGGDLPRGTCRTKS
jgi:hypothetical protein